MWSWQYDITWNRVARKESSTWKRPQEWELEVSELDREAKYNVLCDEYATQAANSRDETELPYKGSRTMISIGGEWITSNIEQRVSDASTGPEMKKYILERFKWDEERFNCINWDAIEQARRWCSKKENIKVCKLIENTFLGYALYYLEIQYFLYYKYTIFKVWWDQMC